MAHPLWMQEEEDFGIPNKSEEFSIFVRMYL